MGFKGQTSEAWKMKSNQIQLNFQIGWLHSLMSSQPEKKVTTDWIWTYIDFNKMSVILNKTQHKLIGIIKKENRKETVDRVR